MSIAATVGSIWIVFTSALGSVAVVWAAYQHFRRLYQQSVRGAVEESRDVAYAMKLRQEAGA